MYTDGEAEAIVPPIARAVNNHKHWKDSNRAACSNDGVRQLMKGELEDGS